MKKYALEYDIKKKIIGGPYIFDRGVTKCITADDTEFDHWIVTLVNSKRNAAVCDYEKSQIQVSTFFLDNKPTLDEVDNVMLHEIAHMITGPNVIAPHGDEWKQNCKVLGCDGARLVKPFTKREFFKYQVVCKSKKPNRCVVSRDRYPKKYLNRKCQKHGEQLIVTKTI